MPTKQKKILVMDGPNLRLLGRRPKKVYGKTGLSDIHKKLKAQAKKLGVSLDFYQSDHEGALVEAIGAARGKFQGILLNPAAYTHTSVAIHDAIEATGVPVVEVHLTNIYARESFRQNSLVSPVAVGQVSGFGVHSYELGLQALVGVLGRPRRRRR